MKFQQNFRCRRLCVVALTGFFMSVFQGVFAQNSNGIRADTVLLSVLNTGAKYRIIPALFGARTNLDGFIGDMIFAQDTSEKNANRGCDTINMDLRDKIVLLDRGECEFSQKCLNAQRSGAFSIIIINDIDGQDSLAMGIGTYGDSVLIPCFSVSKVKGEKMRAMLPSVVGIRVPTTMPTDAQRITFNPKMNQPFDMSNMSKSVVDSTDALELGGLPTIPIVTNKTNLFWVKVSPNPASEIVFIDYQLNPISDASVVAKNVLGHIVYNNLLTGSQIGTLTIPINDWANGIYFFEVVQGNQVLKTLKIAVQH
jgi:PA domain/Secretion system C-terminal sorting domain